MKEFDPIESFANMRHEFGEHGGVNMSIESSTTYTVMSADTLPEVFRGRKGPDEAGGGCFLYGRHFNPTVYGVIAVGDRRPDLPRARLIQQRLHIRIPIVGLAFQLAAELRFGIFDQRRKVHAPFETEHERLVIGNELRKETQHEQDRENLERPKAAPVGTKVGPAASR